ncbi:unnamed protein product, partial [Tilletia caries]
SDEEMKDVDGDGEMGDPHETKQGAVKSAADLQETAGTRTSGIIIPVRAQASASSISKEITIPVHKASSAAPKATIFRPAPTSVSRPATNSDPTTQMGSKLPVPFKITTAAPASSQRAPQTTSAVPSPALGNMRAVDASKLEDPTAMALRSALQVRFSELPEAAEVDDALQLLETVYSCGASKDSNGDPAFVAWLEELEKLDPATIDDEDELGECFGHRAIGRWKYDTPLSSADTWGRAANAFKLLSALLRIWHIGRQQLIDRGSSTQPLVHNHIAKVCARIKLAFKIGSFNAQSSTQNAEAGPSTSKTDKKRARVSMELKQGVITANAIKRLSKKDATQILKSANIKFKSGALSSA